MPLANCQHAYVILMAMERLQAHQARAVPHLDGGVITAAENPTRRGRQGSHCAAVALEGRQALQGLHIPHAYLHTHTRQFKGLSGKCHQT